MTTSVTRGSTKKPVATASLIKWFEDAAAIEGNLWTGFPVLRLESTLNAADALAITTKHGVVVFDLVEGADLGDFATRQDELVRVLKSRLLQHPKLVRRRDLVPAINAITYAPGVSAEAIAVEAGYYVADADNLDKVLADLKIPEDQAGTYLEVLSAIQNLAALASSRTPRSVKVDGSRGARLKALEASISTLDHLQSKAVIETIDGVQRIRGLAGSGKTIVLALKAAYLHAMHPEWNIAVTFNTRSLQEHFKRLITQFAISQMGAEPDWERLQVMNAWGGAGSARQGIYSTYCQEFGVQFHDFGTAARASGGSGRAFDWACSEALKASADNEVAVFDAILVDEAQDLPPDFLRMCHRMLSTERRLVYAYDELQSLDGRGIAGPEELFGTDPEGNPRVHFDPDSAGASAHDIILQKCYRNSRPVLVTAHAVGFGIYRDPPQGRSLGLVQMFDNPVLWSDIGYHVVQGDTRPNEHVVLARTPDASPVFLEAHSPVEDLVTFQVFDSVDEQDEWVAEEIERNLKVQELRFDDIMVVNPNGMTARSNLGPLRAKLMNRGIENHLAGVDTSADVFFNRGFESVTFTGIYRAKGNEAGMVYVVNAQEGLGTAANQSTVRNRLFTAITRSKAWVRVVGVGPAMVDLAQEFEKTRKQDFKLDFRYPTDEERALLNIVHRDLTPEQERRVQRGISSVESLLEDLLSARLYVDDLDPDVRDRLAKMLKREGDA